MLKRVVSLMVGIACLISMTSAFAAMTYDATRTEYFSENQIKVTSTVTGANGDVATYLVFDEDLDEAADIAESSDIIYVDQYKFTENRSWDFVFVTNRANVGSKIQVGNGATSPAAAPEAIPGISYPVTVSNGSVSQELSALTDGAEDAWVKVPYASADSIIVELTFNGTALSEDYWFTTADALWIGEQDWDPETNTIDVTVEEIAASSASTISMAYFASGEEAVDGYSEPSVVVVGQVEGYSEKYGIILGESTDAIEACLAAMNTASYAGNEPYVEENAAALPSLGKNSEGMFAIRAYDDELAGDLYAATYFFDGEEYQISGNCKTISID